MCPGAHITALPIVKLMSSQFLGEWNVWESLDGFSQFMKTTSLVLKPFLSFKNHLPRFKGLLSQDVFPNSPVIITPFPCIFIWGYFLSSWRTIFYLSFLKRKTVFIWYGILYWQWSVPTPCPAPTFGRCHYIVFMSLAAKLLFKFSLYFWFSRILLWCAWMRFSL